MALIYDYAKVKYTNVWAKVEIVCKKHGSFYQSYQAHIYWKYGCTQCNNKNKNITLIRIPYTELKNIKEILTQHLYGNKI
jgi:hypothetical protein